jgi:hypothetical protein
MTAKKIRYLLEEKGRYYYQRKVPKALTHVMKTDRWHLPVGNEFETATDRVKELKKEHDTLIAKVKVDSSHLVTLRREGEARMHTKDEVKAKPLQVFMESVRRGDIDCYPARAELAFLDVVAAQEGPAWQNTPDLLEDLQEARKPSVELDFNTARKPELGAITNEEYSVATARYANIAPREFFDKWRDHLVGSERGFTFSVITPITDDEFSDRLSDILTHHFSGASAPDDEDQRLEFDMLKMKVERLVARYSPAPNKLSNVFEQFLAFTNIKTKPKYRRVFNQFLVHSDDIPISHVTPTMLREYRNKMLADGLSIASVKAAFTPLKSLFRYALDEEIVGFNPTQSVTFPKDTRPIGEIRHLPFEPKEVR